MARKPRIHYPGALYHVMLRSSDGAELFIEDPNCQYAEALVAEGVARLAHRIYAYCRIYNYVHPAIEVAHTPFSKIIQYLAFRYVRTFFYRESGGMLIEATKYFTQPIRRQIQPFVSATLSKRISRAFERVAEQLGLSTTMQAGPDSF